jgi:hypothetical protein
MTFKTANHFGLIHHLSLPRSLGEKNGASGGLYCRRSSFKAFVGANVQFAVAGALTRPIRQI